MKMKWTKEKRRCLGLFQEPVTPSSLAWRFTCQIIYMGEIQVRLCQCDVRFLELWYKLMWSFWTFFLCRKKKEEFPRCQIRPELTVSLYLFGPTHYCFHIVGEFSVVTLLTPKQRKLTSVIEVKDSVDTHTHTVTAVAFFTDTTAAKAWWPVKNNSLESRQTFPRLFLLPRRPCYFILLYRNVFSEFNFLFPN